MILELLQPRIETLHVATERLRVPLGGAQLVTENANLIAQDVDLLLDLAEIDGDGPGTALFAPVDLVKTCGQRDEAGYRQNDRKSQSYVPAAHAVDSTLRVRLTPYGIVARRASRLGTPVPGTQRHPESAEPSRALLVMAGSEERAAMNKSDDYREKAEECRRMAATVSTPIDKVAWLQLARDWLRLIREQTVSERFNAMERDRGRLQGKLR